MAQTVDIFGVGEVDFPDDMSEEDIGYAIENEILPNMGDPDPQDVAARPDLFPNINRGSIMGGLEGGLERAGRIPETVGAGVGRSQESLDSLNTQLDTDAHERRYTATWGDVKDMWERGDYTGAVGTFVTDVAANTLGESLVPMAGAWAGAYAGAKVGALAGTAGGVFAPVTVPLGTAAGAIIGGTLAGIPSFFGMNVERQVQENNITDPEQIETMKAASAAMFQSAAEMLVFRAINVLPGFRNMGEKAAGELLREGAAKLGKVGVGKEMLKAAGRGGATEAVTEVGQQMLERAQAGLEVTNPEALEEYIEAAVLGGFLGLGFGAVGGANTSRLINKEAGELQQDINYFDALKNARDRGYAQDASGLEVGEEGTLQQQVLQIEYQPQETADITPETVQEVAAMEVKREAELKEVEDAKAREEMRLANDMDEAMRPEGKTPAQLAAQDLVNRAQESQRPVTFTMEELEEHSPKIAQAVSEREAGQGRMTPEQDEYVLSEIEEAIIQEEDTTLSPDETVRKARRKAIREELYALRMEITPTLAGDQNLQVNDVVQAAKDKKIKTTGRSFDAFVQRITGVSKLEDTMPYERKQIMDVLGRLPDPEEGMNPYDPFPMREQNYSHQNYLDAIAAIKASDGMEMTIPLIEAMGLDNKIALELRDDLIKDGFLRKDVSDKGEVTYRASRMKRVKATKGRPDRNIAPTPERWVDSLAGDPYLKSAEPAGPAAPIDPETSYEIQERAQVNKDGVAEPAYTVVDQNTGDIVSVHTDPAEAEVARVKYKKIAGNRETTSVDLRNTPPTSADMAVYRNRMDRVRQAEAMETPLVKRLIAALRDKKITKSLRKMGISEEIVASLGPGIEGAAQMGKSGAVKVSIDQALQAVRQTEGQLDEKAATEAVIQQLARVLSHEGIHALRDLGVLKEDDFKALARYATKKARPVALQKVDDSQKRNGLTYFEEAELLYNSPRPDLGAMEGLAAKGADKEGLTGQERAAYIQDYIEEEAVAEAFRDWANDKSLITGRPASLFRRIVNFFKGLGGFLNDQGATRAEDIFKLIEEGELGTPTREGGREGSGKFSIAPPVDSVDFKLWFVDSTVRDENYQPRSMYHGTTVAGGFRDFEDRTESPNRSSAKLAGHYFTPYKEEADWYGRDGGATLEVYLNLTNPLMRQSGDIAPQSLIDAARQPLADTFRGGFENEQEWVESKLRGHDGPLTVGQFMSVMENAGVDGLLQQKMLQEVGYDGMRDGSEHVVFSNDQVKIVPKEGEKFSLIDPNARSMADVEADTPRRWKIEYQVPGKPNKTTHVMARNEHEARIMGANSDAVRRSTGYGAAREGTPEFVSVVEDDPSVKYSLANVSKMTPPERINEIRDLGVMSHFDGPDVEQALDNVIRDNSHETLVFMTPDEYIAMATYGLRNPPMVPIYAESIDKGMLINRLMRLTLSDSRDGGVTLTTQHDGRHRVHALKKLGYTRIPVLLQYPGYEWGNASKPASAELESQQSTVENMPMPDSVIFPVGQGNQVLSDVLDGNAREQMRRLTAGLALNEAQHKEGALWEMAHYRVPSLRKTDPTELEFERLRRPLMERASRNMTATIENVAITNGAERVYAASAFGKYGDYTETSVGLEGMFPQATGMEGLNQTAAEIMQVAKDQKQQEAYAATSVAIGSMPDEVARPGMTIFFYPQGEGATARNLDQVKDIINRLATKAVAGFTAFKSNKSVEIDTGFEGIRFIWMPEYVPAVNPTNLDKNKLDILRDFDRIAQKAEELGIGSVQTESYIAALGSEFDYDATIKQLKAPVGKRGRLGQIGEHGPWRRTIREGVAERTSRREAAAREREGDNNDLDDTQSPKLSIRGWASELGQYEYKEATRFIPLSKGGIHRGTVYLDGDAHALVLMNGHNSPEGKGFGLQYMKAKAHRFKGERNMAIVLDAMIPQMEQQAQGVNVMRYYPPKGVPSMKDYRIYWKAPNGETYILGVEKYKSGGTTYAAIVTFSPESQMTEEEKADKFDKERIAAFLGKGKEGKFSIAPPIQSGEFKRWFKKGAVVDENGKPLPLYHGTDGRYIQGEQFLEFDTSGAPMGEGGGYELGSHFGTSEVANSIVEGVDWGASRLLKVYLNLQNPLRLVDYGDFSPMRVAGQLPVSVHRFTEAEVNLIAADEHEGNELVRKVIQDAGYDGVVYLNRREATGQNGVLGEDAMSDAEFRQAAPDASDSYIAFEPNQVKSVFNEEFDAADDKFSVAPHRAKKINPGQYEYRGYEIIQHEGTDHWNITPPGANEASDAAHALWRAKQMVDEYEDVDDKFSVAPKSSQVNMRVNQMAFENDARTLANREGITLQEAIQRMEAGEAGPRTTEKFFSPKLSIADSQALLLNNPEELGLTPELARYVSPIYQPDMLPATQMPSNKEAARWLEQRFPGVSIDDMQAQLTPEQMEHVSMIMAAEVQLGLQNSGNAFDWYSGALDRAIDIVKVKFPMVADDAAAAQAGFGTSSNARFVFTYIMAVTSQNLDVEANAKATDKAFSAMVKRVAAGRFNMLASWGTGDKREAMGKNFDKFGPLIRAMEGSTFAEKLTNLDTIFRRSQTVSEWVADMKEQGIPYSKPGNTVMSATVYGSSLLGPKIGNGFWQNLNGNFSPLTIDLWMRRTWGRLTGKSIGNPLALPAQRERLKNAIIRSRSRAQGKEDHIEAADHNVDVLDWYLRELRAMPESDFATKKEFNDEEKYLKARLTDAKEIAADLRGLKAPAPWKPLYNRDQDALLAYAKEALAVWNAEYKVLAAHYKLPENSNSGKVPPELQPTWARAAKTIITNLAKPLDQVANGGQRIQIENAGKRALEILASRGIQMTMADMQAVLWYPEKELWGALTKELAVDEDGIPVVPPNPLNASYDTVFERILGSQGYEVQGTTGNRSGGTGAGTVARQDGRSQQSESIERAGTIGDEVAQGGAGERYSVVGANRAQFRQEFIDDLQEKHKGIWGRLNKIRKRQLSPGGLLPAIAYELKQLRDGHITTGEDRIARSGSAMRRATKGFTEGALAHVNDMLNGKTIPATTPVNVVEAIAVMRDDIDNLSGEYITILQEEAARLKSEARNHAAVAQQLRQQGDNQSAARAQGAAAQAEGLAAKAKFLEDIIEGNKGEYMTRSYQVHDDPNWFKKIDDSVIQAAGAYIMAQNGGDMEAAMQLIRTLVKGDKTAHMGMESLIKEGKLGAKDLSILMKRKKIAPEIRALMGEYTDPIVNYTRTMIKMTRLIHNTHFLNKLKEVGMGTFLFEEGTQPTEGDWVPLAGINSTVMEPLGGLLVEPDVRQAFQDILGKNSLPDWMRTIVGLNGAIKFGKVVISSATQVRNFVSAPFFVMLGGSFHAKHLGTAAKTVWADMMERDGNLGERMRRYKTLRLVYESPHIGLLQDLLEDGQGTFNALNDIVEQLPGGKVVTKVAKTFVNWAKKFYRAADDFWKIVAFESQLDDWVEATGDNRADAEETVAERVRNTIPTYSMTGVGMKNLGRFPLVGSFVAFSSEVVRTNINTYGYMKSDMSDPRLAKLGRRRAIGMVLAHGWAAGLSAATMAMVGIDDDEEEAVRKLGSPWARNSDLLIWGRNDKGQIETIDLSFLDPYNMLHKPIKALFRNQPVGDKLAQAVGELIGPFFGVDIAAGAIYEVIANRKIRGGPIYNADAPVTKQAGDIGEHLLLALGPGVFQNIRKVYKAMDGDVNSAGKPYVMADELLGAVGLRFSTFDPKFSLYFRANDYRESVANSRKYLSQVSGDLNEVSDSDLTEAFNTANDIRLQAFDEMRTLVNAARRSGVSDGDLRRVLRASGINKRDANAFARNRDAPKWRIGRSFMKGNIKRAKILLDRETAMEMRDRRNTIRQQARSIQ